MIIQKQKMSTLLDGEIGNSMLGNVYIPFRYNSIVIYMEERERKKTKKTKNPDRTDIFVHKSTREELKKLKMIPQEPYNSVIEKLIASFKEKAQETEKTQETEKKAEA